MIKKVFFLALFLIFPFFRAQETEVIRRRSVLAGLHLSEKNIKEELYREKRIPGTDKYIIVIPVRIGEAEDCCFAVQNYIVLTDRSGTIDTKYKDKMIDSDAITFTDVIIDTGYYYLNEGNRAFGIRHHFTGRSHANPYTAEDISMFYVSGKTLKKVLNRYELNSYSGEWDTNCAGRFEDKESFISVQAGKSSGFADLRIKKILKIINNKPYKGECMQSVTSKTVYKTLKFSNGTYK